MTYRHDRELQLAYSPRRGFWNFVLHVEPHATSVSAINATPIVEDSDSRYAAEWLDRLTPCEPDALHVARVGPRDAGSLWHPCVYEDPQSPSAVAEDGCICWKAFRDPETWLPVAANHYRTVTGNIEQWRYYSYAPLALPDDERLDRLIIDRQAHVFWVRTQVGTLHLLPEKAGAGYGVGYGGAGPAELARMIQKIAELDGYDVSAGTARGKPAASVFSWVSSRVADRTQELTLDQLKHLRQTGAVA